MQATSNPQDVDPNEIGIVPEHEELVGYVYKRVVREVLARIDQRLAELEKHATSDGSEAQSVLSGSDGRGWIGRWAVRGGLGVLLLVVVVVGAFFGLRGSDNDSPVRSMASRLTPDFASSLFTSKDGRDAATEGSSSTSGQAASDGASLQSTAQSPSAPQNAADNDGRASGAGSADLAPLLQKMAHDISNLEQGIDQLKLSQEQMSRDNASAVQQLQAGQDQLARIFKPSAQNANAQAKPVAPQRATPAARPPRRPAPQQGFFRRAN